MSVMFISSAVRT